MDMPGCVCIYLQYVDTCRMDRCIDGCMHACTHVYIKYTAETLYINLESISLSLYLATSSRICGCRFTNSIHILIAPPKKDRKVVPEPHA